VNADNPTRISRKIIEEQGPDGVRVGAAHCMEISIQGWRKNRVT
jgi:hypothetical protein